MNEHNDNEKTDLLGMKKISIRQTPVMEDGLIMHCHIHYQISVCLSGSGVYTIGKKQYEIAPGDIVLLNQLENHRCLPSSEAEADFIFCEFTEDFIAPVGSSEFEYQYFQPFRYDPLKVSSWICHKEPVAAEICRLAVELKTTFDRKEFEYEHEMDAMMKLILSKLRSYYLQKYPNEFLSKHSNSVAMSQALKYISDHFMENIRISEIAKLLSVSESRFRHFFKETMHSSVKSYIIRLRTAEAQKLLAKTDLVIEDIACRCGFGNITHFYKTFKHHSGVTPSEYRKVCAKYSGNDTHYYSL